MRLKQNTGISPGAALGLITLGDTGWSDPSVGTWDDETKTGTLTMDVTQGIEIVSDYVTLDGNGHSVSGGGATGYGVSLQGRTGVTVKNLNVVRFAYGISLASSSDNKLSTNTISSNVYVGILLTYSNGNELTGNTVDLNGIYGIELQSSNSNTLTGNTADWNPSAGIHLLYSDAVLSGCSIRFFSEDTID